MLDFINEISESRIYRNADGLKGKTAEDIARIAFLTVMMLEVLRFHSKASAKSYAQKHCLSKVSKVCVHQPLIYITY